jgi:hypothetical protein
MIMILTATLDVHADRVAEKLTARGVEFIRFNPAQFPSQAELSLSYSATGKAEYCLRVDGETIDLSRLRSIWYRRPDHPAPHEEITDQVSRDFIEGECQTIVQDIWNSLGHLFVPASPAVVKRAQFKASQLKVAGALGFELPPTLISNSPADFLEFYRQHNGHLITKLAGVALFNTPGSPCARYTEIVSKRDVGYARALRYCPIIFQAYVPKQVELRITVVGRKVFAAEIHSQQTNHTRVDWRRYDHHQTPYREHQLPRDVAQRCVQLVESLGLCYGAIDMVLTPDGRYVFLEINPNGQYQWIEDFTGLPISDAICGLLMSGSPAPKPADQTIDLNLRGSR